MLCLHLMWTNTGRNCKCYHSTTSSFFVLFFCNFCYIHRFFYFGNQWLQHLHYACQQRAQLMPIYPQHSLVYFYFFPTQGLKKQKRKRWPSTWAQKREKTDGKGWKEWFWLRWQDAERKSNGFFFFFTAFIWPNQFVI